MRTAINLNEDRLKKIISSVINEVLFGCLPKKEPTGDIYWATLQNKPYVIEEGLIKTYPIENVIHSISGLFDLYAGDDITERNKVLYELDQNEDTEYNGTIEYTSAKNKTKRI